jgi:hypothetical protein
MCWRHAPPGPTSDNARMDGRGGAAAVEAHAGGSPSALVLLCGLPAAGKTTLARGLTQHPQIKALYAAGVHCISLDDVYNELAAAAVAGPAANAGHSASDSSRSTAGVALSWSPELWAHSHIVAWQRAAVALQRAEASHGAPHAGGMPVASGGGSSASAAGDASAEPWNAGAYAPAPCPARLLLMDDNFYYTSMRRPYHNLARDGALEARNMQCGSDSRRRVRQMRCS